jgi:hypothetical protein
LIDDAFVFWRAAGLDTGVGNKRAVLGDMSIFLIEDGVLVKSTRREVAKNFLNGEFVFLQIE